MSDIYVSGEGARIIERDYRERLEQWPVPSEQIRVPTGQGETFVLASGPKDAPALVLLHGSAANTAAWAGDVAAWAEHFRVYAVDMIGEPGLSAPSRPALASDAVALWLDEVLEALGVEHASLVGISLGGWVALDYTIRLPRRVDRLALLCPAGVGRQRYDVLLATLPLTLLGQWGRRRSMELILGPGAASVADYVLPVVTHFRPRREKIPVFGDDALRALSVPVMVTLGGRDALFDSADTRRRLERAVPHARVTYLPESGHLLLGYTRPILDFLRAP